MHNYKTATRNTSCIPQTTVTGFQLEKGTTGVLLGAANSKDVRSKDVRWVIRSACRQHRDSIHGKSFMRNQHGRLQ